MNKTVQTKTAKVSKVNGAGKPDATTAKSTQPIHDHRPPANPGEAVLLPLPVK
jgi:hypothetical protein